METTGRKRTIQILILLACCIVAVIWANSKWPLIDTFKEKRSEFNKFEDNIAIVDSTELNQYIDSTDFVISDSIEVNFDTSSIVGSIEIIDNPTEITINIRELNVEKITAEAIKHLHVREATGNNDGVWVKKFLKITGLPEGHPWCAAYTAYVFYYSDVPAPRSARVVDWFKRNVVWEKSYGDIPEEFDKSGMVGGLFYEHLGRLGHIFIILGEDKNNYYTIEGNTNGAGSREGNGVYKKIRSKKSIAAMADYTVTGDDFDNLYGVYLKTINK